VGLKKRNYIIAAGMLGIIIFRFALIINPMIEPNRGITIDSEQYLSLAQSILDDQRYESPLAPQIDLFRAPGYPVFLTGVLWLTGGSLMAVVLVQYALGLLCAYLLYLLGKVSMNERVGILGAILFLLSPNALFWSATIMTEILFTVGLFLALFMTWRVVRDQFPLWPIGLLLGGLSLIRPIGLYLMLIWGVWLLLGYLLKATWIPAGRTIALFFFIGLLAVTPWFLRNYYKHGKLTLSTVSSTTVSSFHLALSLVEAEEIGWEEAKLKVMEMEADGSALLSIIRSYPGDFAKVQIRGIARTVLGTEVGTWMKLISGQSYEGSGILNALLSGNLSTIKEAIANISSSHSAGALFLLAWGILYTFMIIVLSLMGFIRMMRYGEVELRTMVILMLVIVLYLIVIPGAAGEARFRVPAEPILAFLSAMILIPKLNKNLVEDK
jgi:4-amino-4-deoxy-L-arabinose transferase-like glycosyltransferase